MLNPLHLYRSAYRGLSPQVWLLSGVMLVNRCGTMVLPFLTLYMTQKLGFSVGQAGVVMALFGTGAIFGTYIGGQLTDRLGFYPVQLFSLFFGGLFLLAMQLVTSFPGLCVAAFCFTLLGDTFRPANSSAIAHYSTEVTRTRAFSLNRLAINLGWAVGGGLGGYLAHIDYSLLFWVDGLTCIAAALVLWLALPNPNRPRTTRSTPLAPGSSPQAPAPTPNGTPPAQSQSPYRDGPFLWTMFLTLLFVCAFVLMFSLLPLYFKQTFGLTEAQIGGLMSFNGLLIVVVEMALVYGIEARWPQARQKMPIISLGILLTGLAYLVLLVNAWAGWALVTILLLTVGEMLAMPFMQSLAVGRSTEQNRGQYMAVYSMAWAVSQLISPFAGAQLVSSSGFDALWWVAAGVCVLSAAGFWQLGKQTTGSAFITEP
ncbi:MAG: MFS transporter [Cytophagales bacterium]|nr:MAG: MFS transporter [Cytophagales bacterium]